jgi:pectate lyase
MATSRSTRLVAGIVLAVLGGFGPVAAAEDSATDASYLPTVRAFADNVLKYGRDTYGTAHSPLLVDGVNIDTHEPAVWKLAPEQVAKYQMPSRWVLSNLASQQNLFRVLVVLSEVTGDAKYKQTAVDAIRYMFDHYRDEDGLLLWGGHNAIDLETEQPVGEGRSDSQAGKHELKSHYPFYELMWEVDPKATQRFIEAFWSNHILDWTNLDMNRHGPFKPMGARLWDDNYVGGPVPFVGKGLTFSNTGSDLFYAGAILYQSTGDERPLTWAKRLAKRYVEVRDPNTGLGADNYSIEPSNRMKQQFGPEFGDRFTEATVTSLYGTRYTRMAVCQLKLSERLGAKGEEFKRWAIEDLAAYAKYAYDPSDNTFWPTLRDGTRLKPSDRKRDGYVELRWLEKRPAEALHLWAYALAYKHSGDASMWTVTRQIARGFGLGDFGAPSGEGRQLNFATTCANVDAVFALLDLHAATGEADYLKLARRVGDNVLAMQFHKGFFVADADHVMCKFDTTAPLALLYLEVATRRLPVKLPVYCGGKSYLHAPYDGVRTYDHRIIYTQLRGGPTTRSE